MRASPLIPHLFCLLLGAIAPAHAAGPSDEIFSLERQVEDRLNPILRSFDASAVVVAKIQVQEVADAVLPGTQLTAGTMTEQTETISPKIKKITLTVFGRNKAALEQAAPVMKQLASHFGGETEVTVEASSEGGSDTSFAGLSERALVLLRNAFIGASGLAVILLLVFMAGLRTLVRTFVGSLGKVLQDSEGGSSRQAPTPTAPAANEAFGMPTGSGFGRGVDDDSADRMSEYSEETLVACLTDCYWGGFDAYASYLWQRIPVPKRTSVIAKATKFVSNFSTYVSFLGDVVPSDMRKIDSPAYLAPLGIGHLNNTVLTDLVRQNPGLLGSLSPLRIKGLQLTILERIDLREITNVRPITEIKFGSIPPSEIRTLSRKLQIEAQSQQDEVDLMQIPEPSLELMKEVPSLIWAMRLPEPDLREVLENYSARDLCEAWSAPQETLEYMSKALPAKKLDLLTSLLKRFAPSRQGPSFLSLHRALLVRLEEVRARPVAAPPAAEVSDTPGDRPDTKSGGGSDTNDGNESQNPAA